MLERIKRALPLAAMIAVLMGAGAAHLRAQFTLSGVCGPQPTMTFGGFGIPNNAVMTNANAGSLGVLLGLTATARYSNPTVTNDGACTFFAPAGTDVNPPSPGTPYARWNFDWFVGGANAKLYNYKLFYDFNPAFGNSDYGNTILAPVPGQDSWNLGMTFLKPPSIFPGALFPPTYGPFDPNATGEYTFALVAFDQNLQEVARVATNVDVGGNVVPEPATMTMLAMGLVGMASAGLRRRKKAIQ